MLFAGVWVLSWVDQTQFLEDFTFMPAMNSTSCTTPTSLFPFFFSGFHV